MVKKYGELYLDARKKLLATEQDQAANIARELLSHVSGKSVARLLADRELYASEQIEADLDRAVERILNEEPLAYVLGQWSFYGLNLTVSPDVLIPRDDSMAVTDLAIQALEQMEQLRPRVLDLCTGSGCIGLAIAHMVPTARVTLADISADALKVAKKNIQDLKFSGRVSAFEVDARQKPNKFLGTFDLIVCNPPYVTGAQMQTLDRSVRDYEPHLALYGGEDGLEFYRKIAANYYPALKEDGYLCFEFGLGQHTSVQKILADAGYRDIRLQKDLRGIIRAVIAQK